MGLLEAIVLSVIAASTPLLLAAAGELVVERAGVLNLGVEGMMIMGAACGFAGAYLSGWAVIGAVCGIVAGAALAAVFALLTLGLAVNQVATGLALTILGVGLSGLIGAGFVGQRIDTAPHLLIPILTGLPFIGRILFGQDAFVYVSIALVAGIWWFLYRTRAGLVLRAIGDNHTSAHALGYPVLKVRLLAVLFGGACAGLAGAYLPLAYTPFFIPGMTAGRGWIALALVVFASWLPVRLVGGACAGLAGAYLPLAYTPFFIPGMTAGRGWIALALVVFASWLPARLVGGAYLFGAVTILQLHAQGLGLGIPSQLMSSLPYLATVIVLVLISRKGGTAGSAAPASLGMVFVPDR
jgi:general nucleoside transport system permease protein